jgi:integrase
LQEKKLALGPIALRMGALRFLYKKTLKRRDLDLDDLPLLKTPKKLPVVLSPEEVTHLIEAAPNLLYRTLLLLLYATGLRRAEAAHLKVSDIDSSLMLIHVHQGKGSRDRETTTDPEGSRRITRVLAGGEDQASGLPVPDPQGTHRTREADLRQNGVERVS